MFYRPSIYTVESVTHGHPDKICDQISDSILDECLEQDRFSRVAIEAFGGHGLLVIAGEITSKAELDFIEISRNTYLGIGNSDPLKIVSNVVHQSPDIAQGVNRGGAGDQGIMYGYAINETPEFLPKGIVLVHKLTKGLQLLRESGALDWLRPDGKAQITINNDLVETVLVSTQHDDRISQEEIRIQLSKYLIDPILNNDPGRPKILVNPTGKFVVGGFHADTGLTGRKIMVDTYGGLIPHGGGCFSGKDPTKVDRSGAYMARFVAKNVVASGLTKECLVSVAYAIGQADPLMVQAIDENGRNITPLIRSKFDFRPGAIIERLDLRRPIYLKTASYGHFGKKDLPWEKIECT